MPLALSSTVYAGELERAAAIEHAGRLGEAVGIYQKWLASNPPSTTWDRTLLHVAGLIDNPDRAVAVLLHALPKLSTNTARHDAYVEVGELEELLGDWSGAQKSFQNASLVPGPKDFSSLLESARILLQLGQLAKAGGQVRSIIEICRDKSTVAQARVLSVKLDSIAGKTEQATARITAILGGPTAELLSAQSLGELYAVGARLHLKPQQAAIRRLLQTRYPRSPETSLIEGNASFFPSPAALLGFAAGPYDGSPPAAAAGGSQPSSVENAPAGTGTISIQIGSYLDPANAEYRREDLQHAGFSGTIVKDTINGKAYYKVVVPNVPNPQSQDYLTRLKEKGFEGFLLSH